MDVRRLMSLTRQLRTVALHASQDGRELPISISELAIIEAVTRNPDSTINDLVRHTGFAQSRVSTVVADLTGSGVLTRTRDARDRRQTRVRVDPAMRDGAFQDYGALPVDDSLAEAFPERSPAELTRALALLDELSELLLTDDTGEPPAAK